MDLTSSNTKVIHNSNDCLSNNESNADSDEATISGHRTRQSEFVEVFGSASNETLDLLGIEKCSTINPGEGYSIDTSLIQDAMLNTDESEFRRYEDKQQYPIPPRRVNFAVTDPSNLDINLNIFQTITELLSYRESKNPKEIAFQTLDGKGREIASATWERIFLVSRKIARYIITKLKISPRESIILFYQQSDFIDFVIAFFGCMYANTYPVAVPNTDSLSDLNEILQRTKARLILTTETILSAHGLSSEQRSSQFKDIEWFITSDLSPISAKKLNRTLPSDPHGIAYLEFCCCPTGELRGVIISHENIVHQAFSIMANLQSIPVDTSERTRDVLLSYIDPRQSIGLVFSVLFAVYSGIASIFCPPEALSCPGLFAHLLTKYDVSYLLADYPGLKTVAYNYQNDPKATLGFTKRIPVNLSNLKLAMIDCVTPDTEFNEILADRWFRPLGNKRARNILCPILCLSEVGGLIISMRDWIRPLSNDSNISNTKNLNDTFIRLALSKEALKVNESVILAEGDQINRTNKTTTDPILIDSFWYPIVDMTIVVVDPDTSLICLPEDIGEIWIQSPSVPLGFWDQSQLTNEIFTASPYVITSSQKKPHPLSFKFCRTGLLGFVYKQKVFVLGMYEDRLRQKIEWIDDSAEYVEFRYHYTAHLIRNVMRNVSCVFDCSAFDMRINDEYLPVLVLESPIANQSQQNPLNAITSMEKELLTSAADKCIECLLEYNQLRVYCVLITAPNVLPRIIRNGRREIGNLLTRNAVDLGLIPCVHVQFGTERAVFNLPIGSDPINGIFSEQATAYRAAKLNLDEVQLFSAKNIALPSTADVSLSIDKTIIDILDHNAATIPESVAYCIIDLKGKESSKISWKRLLQKVLSVANHLTNKHQIHSEDPVLLMYSHSIEFIYGVYACFLLGVTPIIIQPIDSLRLSEDIPALLNIITELKVKVILVSSEVKNVLKSNTVAHHLKQSIMASKFYLPPIVNTEDFTKKPQSTRPSVTAKSVMLDPNFAALVLINWTPDQRRTLIQYSHQNIINACRLHEYGLSLINKSSTKPTFLGWIRGTSGIGFFHTCIMGTFCGSKTYLLSPLDFALSPSIFQNVVMRYRITTTYVTLQAFSHAFINTSQKNSEFLPNAKLMVLHEGRPPVSFDRQFRQQAFLSNHISPIYHHAFNIMISSRQFTSLGAQEIWIDLRALRHGLVEVFHPDDPDVISFGLCLVDSGIVVPGTQVAIVNPEDNKICKAGEIGEIWIASISNANGIYDSSDLFDHARYNARLECDSIPNLSDESFMRTGDLGFLHSLQDQFQEAQEDLQDNLQSIYVLGNIGDSLNYNGLLYFPIDIENTVENCHRSISKGGTAVFQTGSCVILLAEILDNYSISALSSLVFVIVNAVLERHQIVFDTISFVNKGGFPRSRLNEKQRGRILASWFMDKLPLVATFPIRNKFQ